MNFGSTILMISIMSGLRVWAKDSHKSSKSNSDSNRISKGVVPFKNELFKRRYIVVVNNNNCNCITGSFPPVTQVTIPTDPPDGGLTSQPPDGGDGNGGDGGGGDGGRVPNGGRRRNPNRRRSQRRGQRQQRIRRLLMNRRRNNYINMLVQRRQSRLQALMNMYLLRNSFRLSRQPMVLRL